MTEIAILMGEGLQPELRVDGEVWGKIDLSPTVENRLRNHQNDLFSFYEKLGLELPPPTGPEPTPAPPSPPIGMPPITIPRRPQPDPAPPNLFDELQSRYEALETEDPPKIPTIPWPEPPEPPPPPPKPTPAPIFGPGGGIRFNFQPDRPTSRMVLAPESQVTFSVDLWS